MCGSLPTIISLSAPGSSVLLEPGRLSDYFFSSSPSSWIRSFLVSLKLSSLFFDGDICNNILETPFISTSFCCHAVKKKKLFSQFIEREVEVQRD